LLENECDLQTEKEQLQKEIDANRAAAQDGGFDEIATTRSSQAVALKLAGDSSAAVF
jgi:hypothetical protein